jgi:hypothetical protein
MQKDENQWLVEAGRNLIEDESIRLFDADRTVLGALLTLSAGVVLRLTGLL